MFNCNTWIEDANSRQRWYFLDCVQNHHIVIHDSMDFRHPTRRPYSHVYVHCSTCDKFAWLERSNYKPYNYIAKSHKRFNEVH